MLGNIGQHGRRIEAAVQHQRRSERHRESGVQVAPGVEHRRWQRRHLAGFERNGREHAADGRERGRRVAVGAFRRSGGAAGQDDDRRTLGGLRRGRAAAAGDQFGESLVGASRRPVGVGVGAQRAQLPQWCLRQFHRLGVLVVVDHQLGALALGHVPDLRTGELGVEHDRAGAHPRAGVVGDHEPPVVAGEDGHAVAAPHAHRQQAVGGRAGGVVEFGEGHRALIVDDGRPVRSPARVERGDRAHLAPAADVGDQGGEVLRRLQPEGPRADHLLQVVQFGRTALGQLRNPAQHLLAQTGETHHATTLGDARTHHRRHGLIRAGSRHCT